jgi:heptosyltransferase-3
VSDGVEPAPRRVLLVNVSRIGDTLLATPALRALAAHWPAAAVDFLGHPKRFEIIEHLPFVATAGPITKHRAPFLGWLSGRKWDVAVVCGFDQPLVAYALRVADRVAAFRQESASLNARLFRCVERLAFQSGHATDVPLTLTRSLGVPDAGHVLRWRRAARKAPGRWSGCRLRASRPRAIATGRSRSSPSFASASSAAGGRRIS